MAKLKIDHFFKDKHNHWSIIQMPNALLWTWIILLLVNVVLHDQRISLLQNAILFAWAYLELTQGASYFRKTLGAVILVSVVASFFA